MWHTACCRRCIMAILTCHPTLLRVRHMMKECEWAAGDCFSTAWLRPSTPLLWSGWPAAMVTRWPTWWAWPPFASPWLAWCCVVTTSLSPSWPAWQALPTPLSPPFPSCWSHSTTLTRRWVTGCLRVTGMVSYRWILVRFSEPVTQYFSDRSVNPCLFFFFQDHSHGIFWAERWIIVCFSRSPKWYLTDRKVNTCLFFKNTHVESFRWKGASLSSFKDHLQDILQTFKMCPRLSI